MIPVRAIVRAIVLARERFVKKEYFLGHGRPASACALCVPRSPSLFEERLPYRSSCSTDLGNFLFAKLEWIVREARRRDEQVPRTALPEANFQEMLPHRVLLPRLSTSQRAHASGMGEQRTGRERTAVAIQKFVQHVASLHADGDIGFSKEYEFIQSESGKFTAENSQYVENKAKNRYLNILAYDHTRVQLLSCGGGPPKKGHDYVNANYIDGWQRTRAYIGTQGPLPPTFDGFWRMVWEQRVSIIVMITNLVERGRKKCDMYWPKKGSETYGCIQVTLLREDVMATYTIRTLQIRHMKVKKRKNGVNMGERIIWQYHYTGWPDHGVPDIRYPF